MKKVSKIFNRILSVFLILVLAFAVYVFVVVLRSGPNRVPSVFGYSFLRVATGSMEPTIPTGSLIVVKKTAPQSVQTGDIICFYSEDPVIEGIPNTHRVAAIDRTGAEPSFTTMGDAIGKEDPYPVHADHLIGVYCAQLHVGKLLDIMHSPFFFFFVLLIPLTIVIILEGARVKRLLGKKKETDDEQIP